MDCPTIDGLEFSERSRKAIARIRKIEHLSNALAGAMAGGVIVTIFAGNNALVTSYNVATQDWTTFAEAMHAIPDVQRNRIELVAAQEVFAHASDPKQRQFWRAVHNGCRIQ
ncbi:MAG: hypothetical protein LAT50_20075 [Ectothiorhodospiraceae bacterium]|nr:hypothetical protein [Ectothiorhodospiraceae bacterium]